MATNAHTPGAPTRAPSTSHPLQSAIDLAGAYDEFARHVEAVLSAIRHGGLLDNMAVGHEEEHNAGVILLCWLEDDLRAIDKMDYAHDLKMRLEFLLPAMEERP